MNKNIKRVKSKPQLVQRVIARNISIALILLFAGIYISQQIYFKRKINVATFHGTYLENPKTINQFTLNGIDQKTFDNASLQGNWTLIFFGFTSCSYLCPTTMAELGKMYRILENKKITNLPHVVMISIDPERDTLERLAYFVKSFHPSFYGAQGGDGAIKMMTREMGFVYAKIANRGGNDPKDYDIEHSDAIMLFNPKGELTAFFTTPLRADLLSKDYTMLVS